jgi:hypothetical protein
MFCAPGLVFGVTEGVGSRFLVLHGRTHFRRYRGLQIPFSCFALSDSFSAVPRASGPVFMFCSPVLVFGGTEGVGSRLHVLRARTRFRWNRGRRVPFSCFALPYSFLVVPRATGNVCLFCTPEHVFDGTGGVGSRFHVLRSRIHFRRYQGRQSHFHVLPAQTRFQRYRGVRSRFHVLRSRTHFQRCRGRRVPFSCFARPHPLSAEPRSSGLVFMFCAPELIWAVPRASGAVFMVGTPGIVSTVRGRRVLFSCFARPDSFLALLRASVHFYVLRSWTFFSGSKGVVSRFHVFALPSPFSVVPRASGPVFMVGTPGIVSTVPRASGHVFVFRAPGLVFGVTEGVGPIFMFCAPVLVFDGTESIRSRFHVLLSRTRFQWYRGRRVPFFFPRPNCFRRHWGVVSCFHFLHSLSHFDGTEGVGSRFQLLRPRTHYRRNGGRRLPF